MDNEVYKQPQSNLDLGGESELNEQPGIVLSALTFLFTIPNMLAGYFQQYQESKNIIQALGGAFGAVILALIIVGVFQLGQRFRNRRSRYKIFMWCQIVILLITTFSAVTAFIQYTNA